MESFRNRPSKPPHVAKGKKSQDSTTVGVESRSNKVRLLKIAGFPAVEALFKCHPERVVRLFYEERMIPKVGSFCKELARSKLTYRQVDSGELAKVAGTPLHGGIVAVANPLTVADFDLAEAAKWSAGGQAIFILDGIGNSHNLGAIARSLAFLGIKQLLITDHPAQAGLTDSAYRVAEGGLEYLDVRLVRRLPMVLPTLSKYYKMVGTALGKGIDLNDLSKDRRPPAFIMGNEEDGLSPLILKACDYVVSIPGCGAVQSLNVSATAAILAYGARTSQPKLKNG